MACLSIAFSKPLSFGVVVVVLKDMQEMLINFGNCIPTEQIFHLYQA